VKIHPLFIYIWKI